MSYGSIKMLPEMSNLLICLYTAFASLCTGNFLLLTDYQSSRSGISENDCRPSEPNLQFGAMVPDLKPHILSFAAMQGLSLSRIVTWCIGDEPSANLELSWSVLASDLVCIP